MQSERNAQSGAASGEFGTYTTPRACGHAGCSATFLDRAAYWAHRIDHEHEAALLDLDNGSTRMAREVRAAFGARND